MTDASDIVEFDEDIALALAESVARVPPAGLKERIMARLTHAGAAAPAGFAFRFDTDDDWLPHPVPGIRMRVLARNDARGYATLLLDVAPGTRFPAHHHDGAEECFVISGSVFSCGQRFAAGDFLHADAETDHGELWTDEGARVLLVVAPEDYMPAPSR